MKLIIFDIDGTLTDTNRIDEEVFLRATKDFFGETELSTDWSDYRESTDSGIFVEVYERARGGRPSAADLTNYKEIFGAHLQAALESEPEKFRAVEGAQSILGLVQDNGHAAAIATGAWNLSAELKLRGASIAHFESFPRATADDAIKRSDIVARAIARSRDHYACDFEAIIYVGDGLWDFRATQSLGIGFIGRCDRGRLSSRLKHPHILQSFGDRRFWDWINGSSRQAG